MKFEEVPKEKWPKDDPKPPLKVFHNNKFLVQVINDYGNIRLTINKVQVQHFKRDGTPNWKDGISWDELEEIKNSVGYENSWMVEIYPPHDKIVNVANMRHLWLLHETPDFGWKTKDNDLASD